MEFFSVPRTGHRRLSPLNTIAASDGLHRSWLEQTTREVEPVSDILSMCV